MSSRLIYHSALMAPPAPLAIKPVNRVERNGCCVFMHDIIIAPLPAEYKRCDIIYADLPWKAGFYKFEGRAGSGHTYLELLHSVNEVMRRVTRGILVCGRTEQAYLNADRVRQVRLNGAEAIAAIYGDVDFNGEDTWDILTECASTYDCIGDFLCGYGRAGWVFYSHGKQFVMSDHNAKCISYIAGWLNEDLH